MSVNVSGSYHAPAFGPGPCMLGD